MASAAAGSIDLPLVGKFRFPCRSIVWVYAAVALLAAIAWQRLRDQQTSEPAGIGRLALCGVSLRLWP